MAINDKYIKGPFKADFQGGIVWGPDNFHFADVRGWGVLGYDKEGAQIQDANLQFMVDALNEKANGHLQLKLDDPLQLKLGAATVQYDIMRESYEPLAKECAELKKEVARLAARESEAVMQSERDARRADANAAECGRLNERVKSLTVDLVTMTEKYTQLVISSSAKGNATEGEIQKEVEWLRYYKKNVYSCLGPADDDINMDIIKAFVREKGIDALPNAERIRHLEYLDEHSKENQ